MARWFKPLVLKPNRKASSGSSMNYGLLVVLCAFGAFGCKAAGNGPGSGFALGLSGFSGRGSATGDGVSSGGSSTSTGGSSSSGASTSDTTPPTVSARSPASGAAAIATSSSVTATFDEALTAASLTSSTFTVVAGETVSGTVSYNAGTKVATFSPDLSLPLGATTTATLTTGITDAAGNALGASSSWTFTTSDGSWQAATEPLDADDGVHYYSQPAPVLDNNGRGLVFSMFSGDLWYNYFNGSAWGAKVSMATTTTDGGYGPVAAISRSGKGAVIWNTSNMGSIYASSFTLSSGGVSISAPVQLGAAVAYRHAVAVDGSGNATAVFNKFTGTYDIKASDYSVAGGTWGASTSIDGGGLGSPALGVSVAKNSSDVGVAAWITGGGVVQVRRYNAGTWDAGGVVDISSSGKTWPTANLKVKAAADSSGNLFVVWTESNDRLYVSRYDVSGGSWSAAQALSDAANANEAAWGDVGVDSSGNAVVIWQQQDGGAVYSVYASQYSKSGGTWSSAIQVDGMATGVVYPRLTVDPSGNATVIYRNGLQTTAVRYLSTAAWGAGSWSAATNLDTVTGGTDGNPAITSNGVGRVLTAWPNANGGLYTIGAAFLQ